MSASTGYTCDDVGCERDAIVRVGGLDSCARHVFRLVSLQLAAHVVEIEVSWHGDPMGPFAPSDDAGELMSEFVTGIVEAYAEAQAAR